MTRPMSPQRAANTASAGPRRNSRSKAFEKLTQADQNNSKDISL